MGFMQELEDRIAQYTAEAEDLRLRLEYLDGLINHAKALLEGETRSDRIPPVIQSNTLYGNQASANGDVTTRMPVSVGVYGMLRQGTTRFSDMARRMPQEYPRIQVQHLSKGISSALHHGMKTGRVKRVKRGLYSLT